MSALEARAEARALDVAAGPYDRRREVVKAVPGARLIHRRRLVNDEGRELTPSELAMRRARRRRFTNTEYPAVALDGATLTDHKNPAGEPIKMKGAIDGDKLVITSLEGTFDGTAGVTETYAMDGETLVLTIADIATGTSFAEKRSRV